MTVAHKNRVTEILTLRTSAALGFVLGLLTVVGTSSAQAQTYKESKLYSFTWGGTGGNPAGTLIWDAQGNLYGTTAAGGDPTCSCGVVFKLNSQGTETVLHRFTGGADGENPQGGLTWDAKGNLYGTTRGGGASGNGTVFKVSSRGTETVLHSFSGARDGANPERETLIWDAKGNLYGTTSGGVSGNGTVFKLSSKGQETVLYRFTGGADGAGPDAGLTWDTKGNLYGTTYSGGAFGNGTVFKLSSKGKETVLYSFTGGADGANPQKATLIWDTAGNLYGTTFNGGTSGSGVVFKLSSTGKESVLYSFTGEADGANPESTLIWDTKGNLYGTTYNGGFGGGTVFKLSSTGKETYSFTGEADGANPSAGLIWDTKGNLYGTTYNGGTFSSGVVFKLTP